MLTSQDLAQKFIQLKFNKTLPNRGIDCWMIKWVTMAGPGMGICGKGSRTPSPFTMYADITNHLHYSVPLKLDLDSVFKTFSTQCSKLPLLICERCDFSFSHKQLRKQRVEAIPHLSRAALHTTKLCAWVLLFDILAIARWKR